jgi:hypothetical protein
METPEIWNKKFANPWKELLPKKEALTLREIVNTLQWGARIDVLTPEILVALEDAYRELGTQGAEQESLQSQTDQTT